jgi:shikimate dehydrogenase
LSEEAAVIGSVNTVVNELGKLIGYNTDVNGILDSLTPYKSRISGNEVCILGAGGSARAVIYTLIRYFKPQKIYVVNRTDQHAEALKQHFKSKMKFDGIVTKELQQPDLITILNNCSLIVNSTPVGMYPTIDDSILSTAEVFVKDQVIFDLVYNPVKTKFLQLADSKNAITINGLNMLIQQAAKSFKLWTGNEFPTEKVYKSLLLYVTK